MSQSSLFGDNAPHPQSNEGVLLQRIRDLLFAVGDLARCKGCGAQIVWVKHKDGKAVPYTTEGLNHFRDCPARDQFRKGE